MNENETILANNPTTETFVEKVKLFKNSKSYNWEIQLCAEKPLKAEDLLDRLRKINNYMEKEYGQTPV